MKLLSDELSKKFKNLKLPFDENFDNFVYKEQSMIDGFISQIRKNQDKSIIELLKTNGYNVPEVLTQEWMDWLLNDLDKKNLYIDFIEYITGDFNKGSITQHLIPFFNSTIYPITDRDKEKIIEQLKAKNNFES